MLVKEIKDIKMELVQYAVKNGMHLFWNHMAYFDGLM